MIETKSEKSTKPLRFPFPYSRPGKASDEILPFQVNEADKFIIIVRVSTRQQDHRGKLDRGATKLREAVESRGGTVTDVVTHVGPGWEMQWEWKLSRAAKEAKKAGATLLAATVDRFIRNRHFQSNSKMGSRQQANKGDLFKLRYCTDGVPLMTFLDPAAGPGKSGGLLTAWGMEDDPGGRPIKLSRPDRKRTCLPLVLTWHQKGYSSRRIADELQKEGFTIHYRTVQRWLNRN